MPFTFNDADPVPVTKLTVILGCGVVCTDALSRTMDSFGGGRLSPAKGSSEATAAGNRLLGIKRVLEQKIIDFLMRDSGRLSGTSLHLQNSQPDVIHRFLN